MFENGITYDTQVYIKYWGKLSQVYILALLKKLKHSTVIVVHNFKDAEELDDLQSMIDSDIKGTTLSERWDFRATTLQREKLLDKNRNYSQQNYLEIKSL